MMPENRLASLVVLAISLAAVVPERAHAAKEFKDMSKDEMRKTFEAANLADDCYDDNVKARDGYKPSGNFVNSKNITVEGTLPDGRQVFTFNQYKHVVTGSSDLKILDATLNDVGQKMKGNYSSDGKAAIADRIEEASAPCAYVYNPENGMITPLSGNDAKNAGYNPNPPNFAAQVLEKDGKTHIAFRGSGASVDDWADTNAGQSLGNVPVQFQMADQLVQSVQDTGSGDVELTGHSEGGGEVQYATLKSVERGEKNVTGSAFNYQQLSTGVKSQFSDDVIKEAGNRVTYYRVGNDAVSGAKILGDGTLGGKEEIHLGDASWKGGSGFGELVDAATGNMGDAHRVVTAINLITAEFGQKVKDEKTLAKEAARPESERIQDYIDHAQKEKDAIRNEIKELGDKDPERSAELMDRYKILTEGIDALKDMQKNLKEKEDQEKAAKDAESNDKKSGKNGLFENEARLEDDTDGAGRTAAVGPDGPSLTKFLNDQANENDQKFQEGNVLNQTVTQEREQEAKNEIASETAKNILDEGGDAAQKISEDSANTTANAQDMNSWGSHLSDALQQGLTAGLTSIGVTIGNEAGKELAGELFGDPGKKGKDDKKSGAESSGKGGKGDGKEPGEGKEAGEGKEPGEGKEAGEGKGPDEGKEPGEGKEAGEGKGPGEGKKGGEKGEGEGEGEGDGKKSDGGKKANGTKKPSGDGKSNEKADTAGHCSQCNVSFSKIPQAMFSSNKGLCEACESERIAQYKGKGNITCDKCKAEVSSAVNNIFGYSMLCHACAAKLWRDKAGMDSPGSSSSDSGKVDGTYSSSGGPPNKSEIGAFTCAWCGKKTNSTVSGVGGKDYCSNACYNKFLESRKQGSSSVQALSISTKDRQELRRPQMKAEDHGSYYDEETGKIKSY